MIVYRAEKWIKKGESCHIFSMPTDKIMETHTHDFIEIVYVRSGRAVEHIGSETYEVCRGDLLFINYGCTHKFVPIENFSYTNICFRPEVLGDGIITPENAFALLQLTAFDEIRQEEESGVVSFAAAEREEIEALLSVMLTEYEKKQQSWQTVLKSYMNILLVRILRRMTAGQGEAAEMAGVWQQLSDYIDRNLGGELTLSALAGQCFYNPSYFSRAFKEKFGMTLTYYITERKIGQAAVLARDMSLSAEQIAERLGYSGKAALSRAFQKVKGVSFFAYRREM